VSCIAGIHFDSLSRIEIETLDKDLAGFKEALAKMTAPPLSMAGPGSA